MNVGLVCTSFYGAVDIIWRSEVLCCGNSELINDALPRRRSCQFNDIPYLISSALRNGRRLDDGVNRTIEGNIHRSRSVEH